jgi:peptidoglycan/xylan/chitin deacetylase (PgdA/CDA1 family)
MRLWAIIVGAWLALAAVPACATQVAITFDDLPAHATLPPGVSRVEVAQAVIAALKAAHTPPVYGFVNGVQLEREPASEPVLGLWRAAGFPLGNHTWSHMNLDQNTVEAFEGDVLKNEPVVETRMAGADWRWLRFPFLAEGDTPEKRAAVRAFLAGRGYHIASVTMSFDDYAFNDAYARCAAKDDRAAIAGMEAMYLRAAEESLAYSKALSQAALDREIPFVLLMHIGAFDARMLPRLLDLYRARGVSFVSLPQAEADPFYAADRAAAPLAASLTLENAARVRGLPLPAKTWNPADLDALCR